MKDINSVLKVHTDSIMKISGVVGVYAGVTGGHTPCIKVMIEKNDPAVVRKITQLIDEIPVEIEVTGRMEPMDAQ